MRRVGTRLRLICAIVLVVAWPLLIHSVLVTGWWGGPGVMAWHSVRLGLIASIGLVHATIYLVLLVVFGITLLPRREPLITTVARKLRGGLTDELALYTRRVTWMWCGFFVAQMLGSLLLVLFAPLGVWSWFVNVLNLPLVLAMFGAEYGYRLWRFRGYPHEKLGDFGRVLRQFKATFPGRSGVAARWAEAPERPEPADAAPLSRSVMKPPQSLRRRLLTSAVRLDFQATATASRYPAGGLAVPGLRSRIERRPAMRSSHTLGGTMRSFFHLAARPWRPKFSSKKRP